MWLRRETSSTGWNSGLAAGRWHRAQVGRSLCRTEDDKWQELVAWLISDGSISVPCGISRCGSEVGLSITMDRRAESGSQDEDGR